MPLKAKRSRHVTVAIPIVAVGALITMRSGQQRAHAEQPDITYHQTLVALGRRQPLDRGLGFGDVSVGTAVQLHLDQRGAGVQACQKDDESFPTITPHDLRHTAAPLAVSAGANVKALQRMLGHAKASMTLDVYADLFDDDLDSVAESLDAAIVKASSAAIAAVSGGSPAPPLLPQGD